MADNPDHDEIIHEAVRGRALRDIAISHDLTVAEVRKIIDEEAALAFSGEQLRREWLLEARRLRALGQEHSSPSRSPRALLPANAIDGSADLLGRRRWRPTSPPGFKSWA